MPYGAVPCRAVLCRAVPRCVMPCSAFSFAHMKRGIYVHACGVRVVFLEHEALGICKSPVLHLKGRAIYHIFHSVPFFLVSERSGLDRPLTRAPYIPDIVPFAYQPCLVLAAVFPPNSHSEYARGHWRSKRDGFHTWVDPPARPRV